MVKPFCNDAKKMIEPINSILHWAMQILNGDTAHIYMYDSKLEQLISGNTLGSNLNVMEEPENESYRKESYFKLAVPLECQERIIGVMIFTINSSKGNFNQNGFHLATMCAKLAVIAIENIKLFNDLQASLRMQKDVELTAGLTEQALKNNDKKVVVEFTSNLSNRQLLKRTKELKNSKTLFSSAVEISLKELTPREIEVLTFIAKGLSNKEIASILFLSISTVKFHVSSILSKLRLSDRTQAALWAVHQGFLNEAEMPNTEICFSRE